MDRIWLGKHCFGFPLVCLALHLLCFETSGAELSYSVPEELTPGTVVGYIAKDSSLDLGKALQRNPRLVSDSNAKYFDMDLSSGALLIKETLDRETICGASIKCHLRLQLILQNPIEMFPVVIEIVDVNDNQPKFQMGNTSLEVSEAAAPGTTFRLECAQDQDVGKNSLRTYALSPNDCFILKVEIKDDGRKFPVLVLNKPLDREKRSVFQLVLTAIDGGKPEKSGTTLITLDVLDVNDNAPEFDQPTQRISLLENSPSGTLVTILNASDADHSLNGAIFFTFDKYTPGHVLELFSLDSLTGEMRVKGSVDHELAALYDITIQARDRGSPSMEGSCSIKIEIIDVNDNTPVIEVKSLSQVISEDAELGTVIAIISVRDEDMGENGDVSVRILPGLPFKLSYSFEEHYTLVTDGVLDREAVAEYTVTVTATDSGSPPRSSQASFVVRLSDVNDNAPVFSQLSYSVDVAENNAPNAPLLTVSAFDPDVRENSTLTFSILEGDIHGAHVSSYVYMNANKGDIYVLRALDYEQMNAFQIVVQVRDMGVPSQSSNVTVHVFVKDVNDHSPALMYPSLPPDGTLQFIVPSSAGKGYLVNRITCVDGDSGHNAWLFYSLSGPDAGLFHVGAHTGELRTAGRLAEEGGRSVFSLAVLVQDNGRPTLSTTVAVNITVAEKGSDITAERRSSMPKRGTSSDLTLYLMVSLTCISAVSLLTLALLLVRWLGKRGHLTCLSHTPCFRHAIHQHPNQDLHLQLNTDGPISYMEVVGQPQGRHKHTYTPCFSTISSRSDFVFVKTPHSALSMSLSKRLFTNSFRKQKPPNNDWRLPPNQRPGPSGQHRFHTMQQRWTPYDKARAGARPEEAPGVVAGTGPWPNPPTEAEQLQALMAAANEVSEATATLGPRYNAQYAPDYRQNVYIPGSTATLMANPQQQMQQQQQQQQQQQLIQQALPPAQAMVPVEPPKAAQTPASKKKSTKKDKK